MISGHEYSSFFFLNDPATTEIYTLPLHDALPISASENDLLLAVKYQGPSVDRQRLARGTNSLRQAAHLWRCLGRAADDQRRSEEHTSELQSPLHLVLRPLL